MEQGKNKKKENSRELSRRSATLRENGRQLLGRNDLELSVGAIAWLLIFSPSAELCGMTEAVSLHVVVSDFHHQLGPERLP